MRVGVLKITNRAKQQSKYSGQKKTAWVCSLGGQRK